MTAKALRLFAARPRSGPLFDLVIAITMLVGSLALLSHGGNIPSREGLEELDLVGMVLAAFSTLPLIVWRRFPLGVFALTAAAGVSLAALGYPFDLMLGPVMALFLLAASREAETPWTLGSLAVVVVMVLIYLVATAAAQETFSSITLLHGALPWIVAWFAGERARLRRQQIAELEERALHAEGEKERERLLAVSEERTRIARDLHDSAGHAINVIAVRAGAARLRHQQDSDRTVEALGAIEQLARETIEEIDNLVGTLRRGEATQEEVDAPTGLASLDTLIGHHTAAGTEVTFQRTGTPRKLNAAADQAAYRILQEALTNAARHGDGSAQIELAYEDATVDLIVTNPVPEPAPPPNGGHGLIGMRERATLVGGSLDTENANGSFRVHARIPNRGTHPN